MLSADRTTLRHKSIIRRVVTVFRPYWRRCSAVLLLITAINALGALTPLIIGSIIDGALTQKDLHLLTLLTLALIALPIATGLLSIGLDYLKTTLGQRVMYDLRVGLYAHLQQVSLRFYTGERTGEIISRLSNDIAGVKDVITDTLGTTFSDIVTIIAILIVMLRLNSVLTVLCLALVPFFLWLSQAVGKVYRRVSERKQRMMADVTALLEETLSISGTLLIKSFGRQGSATEQFAATNSQLMAVEVRQTMIARWFLLSLHIFFALVPALIYYIGGREILGGTLSLGELVAFTSLQASLYPAIRTLLNTHVELQGARALFERIFEYRDLPVEIADCADASPLEQVIGHIRFRQVGFCYRAKHRTLTNVDFEAQPGQLVALVGPSGAGKTTTAYLLPRLYDVTEGAVEIDGHDVRTVTLESLARQIGMVTQETYLLNASIRENIAYGRPEASDAEIIEAALAAQLHERIMELPAGYATVIGPRGYMLSGGEKQRVAIARVLLKNPRILILDEATSALDTRSERLIQSALARLQAGRTTLAIAHRLSTIQAADLILVMDQGSIVERGTHTELLKQSGLYAQFYREQFVPAH